MQRLLLPAEDGEQVSFTRRASAMRTLFSFLLSSTRRVTLYSCARNSDVAHSFPLSVDSFASLTNYSPPSLWLDLFR